MYIVTEGGSEIEKKRWSRAGYTGRIHTDTEYRDTHSHCSLPDSAQNRLMRKELFQPPNAAPDFRTFNYADCCLATNTLPAGEQSFGEILLSYTRDKQESRRRNNRTVNEAAQKASMSQLLNVLL